MNGKVGEERKEWEGIGRTINEEGKEIGGTFP